MSVVKPLRILVAPLDWGLGHTTRCVPLIKHMQQLGHVVTFAGNDWQRQYIVETFGTINTIHLDGYDVTYSRSGSGFMFSMLRQAPGILKAIRNENKWLADITKANKFDCIISDNRYGLFHAKVPSVIMTHQLSAQTAMGSMVDAMLRKVHYKYLQRFSSCWIVDVPGTPNLSGKLAHPTNIPNNGTYIGLLTQAKTGTDIGENLMVLLSGPEPQRTILSKLLWEQCKRYSGKVIFVEGSKKIKKRSNIPPHISYHTRLAQKELQPLLESAKMIVCRSGYSTLMDLVALGKQAILIPTPGQTEQEYLGKHLHSEGVFYSTRQKGFNLQRSLHEAGGFPYKKLALDNPHELYKKISGEWLGALG